jgi:KDO2-lipid IV(A) lauroyltransferase
MHYLTYLIFKVFVVIFSWIPFRVLFFIADLVYYLVYYLAGYRKKVVFENLRNSFPEKKESEIIYTAKAFYHHLADMLIESMKAFSMKESAVVQRYEFINTGVLDEYYRKNQSLICIAGHYGNWEWAGLASERQLQHRPVGFYKPLSNKYMDAYIQRTRVQGNAVLAPITRTAETFRTDWGKPAIFYMVADQSPSSARLAFWINFLNQETAALHGPEKYAMLHNLPVVFASANKIRRGYYQVTFQLLEENPAKTKTGQITSRFMKMLEEVILAKPEYYLWSHRRWKLKR